MTALQHPQPARSMSIVDLGWGTLSTSSALCFLATPGEMEESDTHRKWGLAICTAWPHLALGAALPYKHRSASV